MKLSTVSCLCILGGVFFITIAKGQEDQSIQEKSTSTSTEQEPDKAAIESKLKAASVFVSTKKFDKALEEYNAAIDLDPENAGIYIERGGVNFLTQELDAAKSDYDKAVTILEKRIKDHTKKAKIKRVLDDQIGASIDSQVANDLKSQLSEAYFRRGNVSIFLDDMENGCKDVMESMNLGYPSATKTLKEFCGYEDKKQPASNQTPTKPTAVPEKK